jgi:parallel beta-helix repeat protein
MRGTAERRSREGPGLWVGVAISLLVSALAVALAVYSASVRADPSATPSRPPPPPALNAGAQQAVRNQTELTAREDARLLALLRAVPHLAAAYVDRASSTPAAVLTLRPRPYDVDDLVRLGAAQRPAPDVIELVMPVLVAPGARLEVHAPGSVLRMTSTPAGFTSLVAWKAAVTLSGEPGRPLAVTSWDTPAGGADSKAEDGRAYLRAVGAEMRIESAAVSALGFWSGRTGGVAFTGSDDDPATGAVVDTTINGCHYGLFSSDTRDLRIERVAVEHAAADGMLFYRGTVGAQVNDGSVRSSGADGLATARGTSSITVTRFTSEGNAQNGIALDGRPLATRPGPSGASMEGGHSFRITDSTSRRNGRVGILVRDADDSNITGNEVDGNTEGVVVRGPARSVVIRGNVVTLSRGTAIGIRDGAADVVVTGNVIGGATTGVQVRNARAIISGNRTEGLTAHGVSVQGVSGGSAVLRNLLVGRGPSAVDLYRLQAGATVAVAGNGTESWETYRTFQQRVRDTIRDHPLLPLWVVLLAVPAVATIFARSRRRRGVRLPYRVVTSVAEISVAGAENARSNGAADAASGTRLTLLATGWPRTRRAG